MRAICLILVTLVVVAANRNTCTLRAQGSPRIVGGQLATLGQFPYQAFIRTYFDQVTMQCGGSLITTTKVLTAAHCVAGGKKFHVKLGTIHKNIVGETGWATRTQRAMVHPQYNISESKETVLYDVGIIFLMEPAPLGMYIKLIALPSPLEIHNSFNGVTALVAGFGMIFYNVTDKLIDTRLRWTKATVISNELCVNFWPPSSITEATLCAGDSDSGACLGDSGGALALKTNSGYKQIGIFSFLSDDGCGLPIPDVYTRVTSVLDWITLIADDTV